MRQKNADKKNQFPEFDSLDLSQIDHTILAFWKENDRI